MVDFQGKCNTFGVFLPYTAHRWNIERAVSMIGSHLLKEGTDKTVEVLYVAGQFIRMVMEDNAKLACELSKNAMDYICSFDSFVQRLRRMNR